ncbi:MAG: riboflavin biosynthesis protein RibF [Oligoflexia bacterium]|nr:riboflavin biosynthesis protein RibF [Oligoflexia bacterium]
MSMIVRRFSARPVHNTTGAVVTVGNFDGVHKGHQILLDRLVSQKRDRGLRAVVVTFYPHPGLVLGKFPKLELLTTLRQKAALLEQRGVDELLLIHFDQKLAGLSAGEFVDRILMRQLGMQELVLGPDACFGRRREGTPTVIRSLLAERGLLCHQEQLLDYAGSAISSSRIRAAIKLGDVTTASALLGRHFTLSGRVKRGARRGTSLGFPTANMRLGDQVLPKIGVYAAIAKLDGVERLAVTNVGMRPTFGGTSVEVETHFLDTTEPQLYGKLLSVGLVARIRDEQKFGSKDELCRQIEIDIASARRLLV